MTHQNLLKSINRLEPEQEQIDELLKVPYSSFRFRHLEEGQKDVIRYGFLLEDIEKACPEAIIKYADLEQILVRSETVLSMQIQALIKKVKQLEHQIDQIGLK